MTIALPPPGKQTSENHVAISHRFLDHAQKELNEGNRLQASEKIWGAMSHALKSIAEQRGWEHPDHASSANIADQLGREFNRERDFHFLFASASDMHRNFYGNEHGLDQIRLSIENAETYVAELNQLSWAEKPSGELTSQVELDA